MNTLDLVNLGMLIIIIENHHDNLLAALSRQDEAAANDELRHIACSAGLVRTMAEAMLNSAGKSTQTEKKPEDNVVESRVYEAHDLNPDY